MLAEHSPRRLVRTRKPTNAHRFGRRVNVCQRPLVGACQRASTSTHVHVSTRVNVDPRPGVNRCRRRPAFTCQRVSTAAPAAPALADRSAGIRHDEAAPLPSARRSAAACGFAPLDLWPLTLACLAGWIALVRAAPTFRAGALARLRLRGRTFHDQQQLVPARLRLPGRDAAGTRLLRRGRARAVSRRLSDGRSRDRLALPPRQARRALRPDLRRRLDRDRMSARGDVHRLRLGPAWRDLGAGAAASQDWRPGSAPMRCRG